VPELLGQWLADLRSKECPLERVSVLKADGSISRELTGYTLSRGVEGLTPEGHGVCWREQVFLVHSPNHQQQQQQGLEKRLETATTKLLKLTPPIGRGRKQINEETVLAQKIQGILKAHRVEGLLEYTTRFEAATPSRKARYQITQVTRNQAAIEQHQQSFGWRVYVSNTACERLSCQQAVLTYRDEWIVEHGFHRFKGKALVLYLSGKIIRWKG